MSRIVAAVSMAVVLVGCGVFPFGSPVGVAYDVSAFAGGRTGGDRFGSINGFALDSAGNLFVSDANERRIWRVNPDGHVTTVAGSGAYDTSDGPVDEASFQSPGSLVIANDGSILVVDHQARTIRRIRGGAVDTIRVDLDGRELGVIHATPDGRLLLTSKSQVYSVQEGKDPSLVFDAASLPLPVVSPVESPPIGGANPPPSGEYPAAIMEVAVHHISALGSPADGSIFIAQPFQRRIVRVDPDGGAQSIAYGGAHGLGESVDGPLGVAKLNFPSTFTLLRDGLIAIGDLHKVRIASQTRAQVWTAIGANPLAIPFLSKREDSEMVVPYIVSTDRGVIFFADANSRTIFKMVPR